jgi:hypothetical protein
MTPSFRRDYNMVVKDAIRRTDTQLVHPGLTLAQPRQGLNVW